MAIRDRPTHGWTVVLRRQPVRMVEGQPEGGYTDLFEIICCDCGDHPDLDYRDVSPEFQRIRGPYPIAAGVTAYKQHVGRHAQTAHATSGKTATDSHPHACRLSPGWHEYPAQRLEGCRLPDPQHAGGDYAQAQPAECHEGQQVHQRVGVRMKDPPQRKQEQHDGRGRDDQMSPEPELAAELGAERADGRDVDGQVDEYEREPADSGELPERARAAVGVGQRQSEQQREHGEAADRDDRGTAARQPGQ